MKNWYEYWNMAANSKLVPTNGGGVPKSSISSFSAGEPCGYALRLDFMTVLLE